MKNLKNIALAMTFAGLTFGFASTQFANAQSLGTPQTPAINLKSATQVAPDQNGNLEIVDATGLRVIKRDAFGNFSLDLDANQPIRVGNQSIKLETVSQVLKTPAVTYTLDGRQMIVLANDNFGNFSVQFTRNTRWTNPDGTTDRFESIDQLVAGPNNTLLILDQKGNKIVSRDSFGKIQRLVDLTSAFRLQTGRVTRLKSIDDMVVDQAGVLYLTDRAGFQLVGIDLAYYKFVGPKDLGENQAKLVVSASQNTFRRADAAGTVTIKSLTGVTVNGAGTLSIADTANGQLVTINQYGEVRVPMDENTELFEILESGKQVKIELSKIAAPQFDNQGNAFLADSTNTQVIKIDSFGNASRLITKDTEIRFEQQ